MNATVLCFRTGRVMNVAEVVSKNRAADIDERLVENPTHLESIFAFYDARIDGIRARFGEHPPKHAPIYVQKLKDGASSFETYGHGCVHDSIHQYMPKKNSAEAGRWNRPFPFPCDLRAVHEFLKNWDPENGSIVVGLKSDPFMWMDAKYEVTKSVIKLANSLGVRLIFHTISDLCAHDDYLALLKEGGHSIVMNIGFLQAKYRTDEFERRVSPGGPSLSRRRNAVEKLQDAGIPVSMECTDLFLILKNETKIDMLRRATGIWFTEEFLRDEST